MRKLFSKPTIFILPIVLFLIFGGVFIRKKLTVISPGGNCGGLIMPKYKWMRTLGLFPPKCARGYICDYSDNPPGLLDAPGTCVKLILDKTHKISGSRVPSNYPTTLFYSEENLKVTVTGFDDECEKYNLQQSLTGCVNAGKITWYIIVKKGTEMVKFSVSSERHGSALKKEMGYIFDFREINRFSLKFRIAKEESLIETPPLVRTSEFETPPVEVQRAAEEGLPQFLQGFSDDEMALKSYGIKSFEEAQSAIVGMAHLLYTVRDLAQLANYSQGQRASALITPTQTWYFAVLTNNEPRVDLEVSWHESRWQAVRIGGSLSKEMDGVERSLPSLLREKGISTDCSFKLVRIFPLNAVFVFLNCADKEFIIPLTPTGWFDLEKNKLYPAGKVMLNFAEEAKRILKEPPGLVR